MPSIARPRRIDAAVRIPGSSLINVSAILARLCLDARGSADHGAALDGSLRRHCRVGSNDAVAPAVLGRIERKVCALEKLVDGVALQPFADTEAAGQAKWPLRGLEPQRPHARPQALGQLDRSRKIQALEQYGELLAPETPDHGAGV